MMMWETVLRDSSQVGRTAMRAGPGSVGLIGIASCHVECRAGMRVNIEPVAGGV